MCVFSLKYCILSKPSQILLYVTYVRTVRKNRIQAADTFGRVIARASRDSDEVLVADLDLDQRRDWLDCFLSLLLEDQTPTTSYLPRFKTNVLTQVITRNETNHARGVGSSRANLDGLATG